MRYYGIGRVFQHKMTYSELKKQLKKLGCYIISQGGNHEKWYSPVTGNVFPVSRHKTEEVRPGTLKAIKEQSGLD